MSAQIITPETLAQRLAEVTVHHSLLRAELGPVKNVAIVTRGGGQCEPILSAIFEEVLKVGAHPVVMRGLHGTPQRFLEMASERQLRHFDPFRGFLYSGMFHARALVIAEHDPLWLQKIKVEDPELAKKLSKNMSIWNSVHGPLSQLMQNLDRSDQMPWMLLPWPTQGMADLAGMSLDEYRQFVAMACLCDKDNPLERWRDFAASQDDLFNLLKGVKTIHVKGPNNTNFVVNLGEKTKWINNAGSKNLPDGEIYCSPPEITGYIFIPIAPTKNGFVVEGLWLEWKNGRIVDFGAEVGEDIVEDILSTDDGAKGIGEFALGTSYTIQQFTKHILFDEKIGGHCHVACGMGYPQSAGDSSNQSTVHWDVIFPVYTILLDNKILLVWDEDGGKWVEQ